MKNYFLPFVLLCSLLSVKAQEKQDTKVVLITLDGLRWQELFTGADEALVENEDYVEDAEHLKSLFWKATSTERRAALFPFVWEEVATMGQIHGNRALGSKMNLTNSMWFSYPGYNEILSGAADDKRITSNKKIPNPNVTLLEIANKNTAYKGKVAAFGSWDVFPFIVNEKRSGVPVNAGFRNAVGDNLSKKESFLNELQGQIPSPWGSVRLDAFTHHYALEYMKKKQPSMLYIAYGETDDFAHDGNYEAYLKSAHTTDAFLKELWQFCQQDPFYKDQTLFIITTDHGRGTKPLKTWKSHGEDIKGADQVWFMAYGKGASAKGEVSDNEQVFTNQIAPTVLKALGLKASNEMKAKPIVLD